MHTNAGLVGSLCKCMDCARYRQVRVEQEARRRYGDEWAALEISEAEANHMLKEAEILLFDVASEKQILLSRVRSELADGN